MILSADEIKKEYCRGENSFLAVDGATISIDEGEFVSIIGRSDSGKSTLLNILSGLIVPDEGNVSFEGQDYAVMDDKAISELRCNKIGYIMQSKSVLPNLNALQNVLLPNLFNNSNHKPVEQALMLLDEVGLGALAEEYPANLSGGEVRRISIARALLNSPKLILADEPTSELDSDTAKDIIKLFASVAKKGTAILIVTHEPDISDYCDSVYRMDSGQLILCPNI
jgi:putative ABC transport system ATP-binding protein